MGLKIIDGTPTALSEYLRERNIPDIHKKFEKCNCLTNKEKDELIEFIREKERGENTGNPGKI